MSHVTRIRRDYGPANFSRTRCGFTLIELLVVIAVVAILASLLLPALSSSKTAAHSAQCKSNLRQLSLALQFYVDDFNAYPPFGLFGSSDVFLPNALSNYIGKGLEVDQNGRTNPIGVVNCPSPTLKSKQSALYGLNWGGIGDDMLSGRGLAGTAVYEFSSFISVLPTMASEVKVPSDMIALGDNYVAFTNGVISSGIVGAMRRSSTKVGPFTDEEIARTIRTHSRRHGGIANVAFCDGHVEGIKFQRLFFDETDGSLRRWHIDHKPHREVLGR